MAANLLSSLPTPVQVAIRAVLVVISVGALIVMSELDRLIVQCVAGGSSSYSLNALSGPTAFSQVGAWQVWVPIRSPSRSSNSIPASIWSSSARTSRSV